MIVLPLRPSCPCHFVPSSCHPYHDVKCPTDVSSNKKSRMFCHRDTSSQGSHVQDCSFGDTPVRDEITLHHPYPPPPQIPRLPSGKLSRLSSRRARIIFCLGKKELNLPVPWPFSPCRGGVGVLDKILLCHVCHRQLRSECFYVSARFACHLKEQYNDNTRQWSLLIQTNFSEV